MLDLPVFQVLLYSFALWFGLYLLMRDLSKPGLRFAGLGLVAYAVGLGMDTLAIHTGTPPATRALWLFTPSVYWFGATVYMLPGVTWLDGRFSRYSLLLAPAVVLVIGLVTGTTWLYSVAALGAALLTLVLTWRVSRSGLPRNPMVALMTATIFFGLGVGMVILPQDWLSSHVVLVAIGGDLALLGYAIVALDAYDEGELFLPDFLRAFALAMLSVLLLGAQFVLVMAFTGGGLTTTMFVLLLGTITTAVLLQSFLSPIQALLDRLIFARLPGVRQERSRLRAAANALPRLNRRLDLKGIEETEFIRLTRRALGHMGSLERLAASPLTHLPLVDMRIARQNGYDNALERAAELKSLLTESIEQLKPRDKGDFGVSDEWRYYNALYFPYVVGLKPYSRRDPHYDLDPAAREALAWFRSQVPERTLHNWQNTAARLIAQNLRERLLAAQEPLQNR